MNPSIELKNVMLQFYESKSKAGFFSHQDAVMLIGTDPEEWFVGFETISQFLERGVPEVQGDTRMKAGMLDAFEEGEMGWVVDNLEYILPNGKAIPTRVTALFHHEEGEWKIVHYHVSVGIPNAEVVDKFGGWQGRAA